MQFVARSYQAGSTRDYAPPYHTVFDYELTRDPTEIGSAKISVSENCPCCVSMQANAGSCGIEEFTGQIDPDFVTHLNMNCFVKIFDRSDDSRRHC